MGLFPSQMVSMAHRGMCSAQLHQNKYFAPLCCRCCFSIYVRNGFNYIFSLLGQVRGVQTQKYLICILPVKLSSSQSPGFQAAVDEERTTSFLLIILSSTLLSVRGYLKGNLKMASLCVRLCIHPCFCAHVYLLQPERLRNSTNTTSTSVKSKSPSSLINGHLFPVKNEFPARLSSIKSFHEGFFFCHSEMLLALELCFINSNNSNKP